MWLYFLQEPTSAKDELKAFLQKIVKRYADTWLGLLYSIHNVLNKIVMNMIHCVNVAICCRAAVLVHWKKSWQNKVTYWKSGLYSFNRESYSRLVRDPLTLLSFTFFWNMNSSLMLNRLQYGYCDELSEHVFMLNALNRLYLMIKRECDCGCVWCRWA